MTNIPQFRAYNKSSNQMFEVLQIDFANETISVRNIVNTLEHFGVFNIAEIVLMQSTGLHDKNGTEIFQGDVVEFFRQVSHIVFQDGAFWVDQIKISSGNEHGGELLRDVNKQLKIIGNIHTAPNLYTKTEVTLHSSKDDN